jgi:hypothetical protein
MDNDKNINIINGERNFNALSDKQTPVCKFYLLGNCRNSKCKFTHSLNIEENLTDQQKIINEIEVAVNRRQIGSIFKKMLLNADNAYQKYYNEIHMKFRGYSIMKLKKQSIVDMFLGRYDQKNHSFDENILEYRNVKIDDDIILDYGFIPFLFHFFVMGFAWNTFQGATDSQDDSNINECFDEFIVQLQKRYSDQEYDNIVRQACDFVDPDTNENMLMVASHYLCDRVVLHIKDAFKNIKRRQFTKEELSTMRTEQGEEIFNRFITDDFTNFINDEFNVNNETAFDLFNKRRDQQGVDASYQKYKDKLEKSVSRSRGNQNLIKEANKKYEYNIKQYMFKVTIFYNSIFNENVQRKKISMSVIDYDSIFNSRLQLFVGAKNKFGSRCDPNVLSELIHLIDNELVKKKDIYMKKIINNIPNDLMNCAQIIKVFKDKKVIDYLWNKMLDSISVENRETFCPDLLKEFLKEPITGLQEAYASQYTEKLINIEQNINFIN